MRKTGHILSFAFIPSVDISPFISILFLMFPSVFSREGLYFSDAIARSVNSVKRMVATG